VASSHPNSKLPTRCRISCSRGMATKQVCSGPVKKVMPKARAVEGFSSAYPNREPLHGCLAAADRPSHQLTHVRIGVAGGGLEESKRAGVGDLAQRCRRLFPQIADVVRERFAQHGIAGIAQIRPNAFAALVRTCQLSSFMVAINGPIASPMRTLPIEAAACSRTCQCTSCSPASSADTPRPPGRVKTSADITARLTEASGSLATAMSAAARPRP